MCKYELVLTPEEFALLNRIMLDRYAEWLHRKGTPTGHIEESLKLLESMLYRFGIEYTHKRRMNNEIH